MLSIDFWVYLNVPLNRLEDVFKCRLKKLVRLLLLLDRELQFGL